MGEEAPQNTSETGRNPDGTFKPGFTGNPGGRPKGTLKEYLSRKFREMSDEEKQDWLDENEISGDLMWRMAEGQPKQDTEVDMTLSGPTIMRIDE